MPPKEQEHISFACVQAAPLVNRDTKKRKNFTNDAPELEARTSFAKAEAEEKDEYKDAIEALLAPEPPADNTAWTQVKFDAKNKVPHAFSSSKQERVSARCIKMHQIKMPPKEQEHTSFACVQAALLVKSRHLTTQLGRK